METRLPNGIFQCLKEAGKEHISLIRRYLAESSRLKDKIVLSEPRDFAIDFNLYGIDFRIRIELKTDCETTKKGLLAVYRVVEDDEDEPLKGFPIWSKEKFPDMAESGLQPHTFLFQYLYSSHCPIQCPYPDTTYIDFFYTHFPRLVAESALEIDLDK